MIFIPELKKLRVLSILSQHSEAIVALVGVALFPPVPRQQLLTSQVIPGYPAPLPLLSPVPLSAAG